MQLSDEVEEIRRRRRGENRGDRIEDKYILSRHVIKEISGPLSLYLSHSVDCFYLKFILS